MSVLAWSALAQQDVDDIYDYIGVRDGRPANADKFVADLNQVCESYGVAFANGSVLGTARSDLGEEYRVFTHKRWVVAFRPLADGIEILLVVDGSREFGRLFGS